MRIVILSVFPPFRGGIAQFNERMATALQEEGHDLHLVSFKRQYPSLLFPGKSQYQENAVDSTVPTLLDSVNPISWKKTAQHILDIQPDLVIIPFWTGFLAPALTGVMKKLRGIRVLGLMHNAIPHDAGSFQKRMTHKFMKHCDGFISLSSQVAARIASNTDKPIIKSFHPIYDHFPSEIDQSQAREKLGIPQDKKVVLFFGLIRPYKGLDLLFRAFNSLSEEHYLLVAGEAYEDKSKYLKLLTDESNQRFRWDDRFIPDEEMSLFFSAADVVCLPYKNASQSGVTAVAMHYNRLVVASNVGGLEEYIKEGVNGYLFPANDVSLLRESVINALHTPVDTEAYQSWKSQFTWTSFAKRITSSD